MICEELMMKIYMWGTGRIAGKVLDVYMKTDDIEGFIDNSGKKDMYMGKKVFKPMEMLQLHYDAIVVANLAAESCYEQCIELGIDVSKVILLYNNCKLTDINQNYEFMKQVLGEKYAKIVKERYHIVRGVEAYGKSDFIKSVKIKDYNKNDYVRIETFELAVKEIKKRNLKGNTAEAGVFRGEFAQYINAAFPDKTLYLFDTFEGFDSDEARNELNNGNCSDAFIEAYKNTNIRQVLDKMSRLDKIVIKQGLFPDSLGQMEDRFCFVSLDMDFEESIYQGLIYFYPRLEKGGYIFIHDYNSSLRGVESAVDRFERETGTLICKVPLCDANGTLVITK